MPPAWRIRSVTAWIVVPESQTSSTTRMRWPRSCESAGNWRNVGTRTGLALVVVVLDGGDQDVADAQPVGEHPGRDEAAARDRQHEVELLAAEPIGKPGDEFVEHVPGHDVLRGRNGRLHRSMIPAHPRCGDPPSH